MTSSDACGSQLRMVLTNGGVGLVASGDGVGSGASEVKEHPGGKLGPWKQIWRNKVPTKEASLRSSLRQDVRWLRNELFFMQSFLKDAEQKQVVDQRVQQWVFEINSVANDAVAILETYSLEASKVTTLDLLVV
ncbi:hypothetical protein MTR67_016643 [Solanum verrucosum]|uniref:Disease resistance N-terminal domain-containing protein n=1 Tax=Solanum verrucosum TaxID=315347 RepID=A0AAF0TR02_SOLVR|nr:hypothetical protein MTR67_016643 [Solanum verrucosum]